MICLRMRFNSGSRFHRAKRQPVPIIYRFRTEDVPKQLLAANAGWLKVIAGEYENLISKIPSYTKQFLYHIHLNEGGNFSIATNHEWEYAAFLPSNNVVVNDTETQGGDFLSFDNNQGTIEFKNTGQSPTDIILFGGEPYTEPIIAHGPFVMNTQQEIAMAYQDFHARKVWEDQLSIGFIELRLAPFPAF